LIPLHILDYARALRIGNVFVRQTNPPLKVIKVQNKLMFGEWHMSNIGQVV